MANVKIVILGIAVSCVGFGAFWYYPYVSDAAYGGGNLSLSEIFPSGLSGVGGGLGNIFSTAPLSLLFFAAGIGGLLLAIVGLAMKN